MSERNNRKIPRRTVLQGTAAGTAAALGVTAIAAQDDEDDTDAGGRLFEEGPTVGLETVATGLTAPIALQIADEEADRRFIVDQTGYIYVHDEDGLQDEPFLDVTDRMIEINEDFDERGLLGLAFHPDFEENGQFFVHYSAEGEEPEHGAPEAEVPDTVDHLFRLSRFETADDDNESADPDSEEILLEIPEPQFNHNAGPLAFGPDGYLYVATGDGGGANDNDEGHVEDWYDDNEGGNGQDTERNLLGGILRIDVDADGDGERAYGIPDDNPLADADGHLPEYWAWGMRNPWGMSFEDGELLAADVGQGLFESVNHVQAGGNYAWNVWEGTHCFSTENPEEAGEDCPDTVDADGPRDGESLLGPVIEYPHEFDMGRYSEEYDEAGVQDGDSIGVSITGGRMYRGTEVGELEGAYVFGDWSRDGESGGRLFAARPPEGWPDGAENGDDGTGDDANGNETDENGNETDANGNETEENGGADVGDGGGQYHPPDQVDLWPLEELSVEMVGGDGADMNGTDANGNETEENGTEANGNETDENGNETDEEEADKEAEENGDAEEAQPIAEDGMLNHYVYAFGRDADGEVYVLTTNTATTQGEGYVSRIVSTDGGEGMDDTDGNGNETDENGNETDENGNETDE